MTTTWTATGERAQDPGSRLADELQLLLAAVAERAGPWLDRLTASTHDDHDARAGSCEWCPLCAVVAVLRGEPTALAGRAVDRAADLVALLRAVLADRWEPGEPHMPGFRPASAAPEPERAPRPADRGPGPRVQRIPVRRKGDPVVGG